MQFSLDEINIYRFVYMLRMGAAVVKGAAGVCFAVCSFQARIAAQQGARLISEGGRMVPVCRFHRRPFRLRAKVNSSSAHPGAGLEIRWYFAEAFFNRKLLETVQYFHPGRWLCWNPFHALKERQMQSDVNRLSTEWESIFSLPEPVLFETLLHSSLWGNRADLGNFTVEDSLRNGWSTHKEKSNIIIDHSSQIEQFISVGLKRIDFINDNAGADILFDLALANFLLKNGWTQNITFHLKNHPFFVSDAKPEDVRFIISLLKKNPNPESQVLCADLSHHIHSGKLTLLEDPFWTSHYMFRQMPASLKHRLAGSDLVIFKGDVNYRRLLDDLHWPHTMSFEAITEYFSTSLITLRTLKSEIIDGLPEGPPKRSRQMIQTGW